MSSKRTKKQRPSKTGTFSSHKKPSSSHPAARPKSASTPKKKAASKAASPSSSKAPLKRKRPAKKRLRLGRLFALVAVLGLLLGAGGYALGASNFIPAMTQLLTTDRTARQTPISHAREVAAIKSMNALDTVDGVSAFSDQELRQCFFSSDIDEKVAARLSAMGYTDQIPLEDLQYVRVLFYDFDGKTEVGELVVNKAIADKVENVFYDLYTHRYPIQKMILPDAYGRQISESFSDNNTVGLCFGLGEENLGAVHESGYAIDLNPLYNPLIKDNGSTLSVFPMEGQLYLDRTIQAEHYIHKDDYAVKAFEKEGFVWKGDTEGANDYKHFEYPHAPDAKPHTSESSQPDQPQSSSPADEPAPEDETLPVGQDEIVDPGVQDPVITDPIVDPIVDPVEDPIQIDIEQPEVPGDIPDAPGEPMPDNDYGPNDPFGNAPE